MTKFQILPKTGYVVSASLDLANFNETTFVNFYLPLMSPTTLGLFSALRQEIHSHPLITDRHPVSELLVKVNAGLSTVTEALHHLEAVGLIKTFAHHDKMGDVVIFELHSTLTPAEFIKDDLLSVQLLAMVGPERFKQLSNQVTDHCLNVDDFENISQSFFDVFHPDHEQNFNADPALQQAQQKISKVTAHRVKQNQISNHDDFSLQLIAQQLSGEGLDPQIVQKYQKLILVEHQTYGYDELALASLIERATNVIDNQFDADQFKLLARQMDVQQQSTVPEKNQQVLSNLDLSGLAPEVQELIKQCEQQTPMAFLAQLKHQTNGYISSAERVIVERLVSQSGLSNGAINLLLWYIIGEQGLGTVKANLADTIANNWGRAGVKTSVDAYNEIRHHQEQREQRHNKRQNYRNRRGSIKEKLPDWAQKDYQPQVKAASAEQIARSKQLLAELRKKQQQKK